MQVSITFAYYKVDPVGFIMRLCENIDKPELECNGKCQLKKVAESSTTNDKKNLPNIIDFKEILLYKECANNYIIVTYNRKVNPNYNYQNFYKYLKFSDCFHPPKKSFS